MEPAAKIMIGGGIVIVLGLVVLGVWLAKRKPKQPAWQPYPAGMMPPGGAYPAPGQGYPPPGGAYPPDYPPTMYPPPPQQQAGYPPIAGAPPPGYQPAQNPPEPPKPGG
jgi:annexin A7/11